jgi:hypothetical protein
MRFSYLSKIDNMDYIYSLKRYNELWNGLTLGTFTHFGWLNGMEAS